MQLKFCCRNSVHVLIHIQLTPVIVLTCIISCIAMMVVCSSENPITLLCVEKHRLSTLTLSLYLIRAWQSSHGYRKKTKPCLIFLYRGI